MAFVFRLEKVAHYRQQLVDEQSRCVAAAARVVTELQGRIAALEDDMRQYLAEFNDESSNIVNVQGMIARTMWVTHLEKMRDEFAVDLQGAQMELGHQRAELKVAWRDLEVLNKLRKKQKAEWQIEQQRRENLVLDEIGQIRADRQRRSKVAS